MSYGSAPEPAAPETAETADPRMPRFALAVLGVVLALSAVLTVVVVLDQEPSPDERLAAIRSFVTAAQTAHFEGTFEESSRRGQADGPVQNYESRAKAWGDFVLPDRAHFVVESGGSAAESLVLRDAVYERTAPGPAALAKQKWAQVANAEKMVAQAVDDADPLSHVEHLAPFIGWRQPGELRRLIGRLGAPVRLGPQAIQATLSAEDLFAKGEADELKAMSGGLTAELTSSEGGRLDRLVWKLTLSQPERALESLELSADLTFTDWDRHVEVAAPKDSDLADVKAAPDLETEALAAFDDFVLYAPRTPPDGFELTDATIEEGTEETGTCPTVRLRWEDPQAVAAAEASDEEDPDYPPALSITLSPADCPFNDGPTGNQAFEAGSYRGVIDRTANEDGTPYMAVYLTVNGTWMLVESALPEAEITRLVADLAPLKAG